MKIYPFIEKQGLRLIESSFSSCFINPENYPENYDLCQTAQLKPWVEFANVVGKYATLEVRNAQVIRYIIAMYDFGSPFKALDYRIRKVCAAEYAGFKTNSDGVFVESIQRILNCELDVVVQMVICYCKISKGILFSTYTSLFIAYHEKTLTNKNVTAKLIAADMEAIMKYEQELLSDDNSPELKRYLYKIVTDEEQRIRQLRPEYMVEKYYANFPTVILTTSKLNEEEG